MGFKTAAPGYFAIPTQPAAFVTVTSGAANVYGTYTQLLASTSAAIFITHVFWRPGGVQTNASLKIGTGPATETDVGEFIAYEASHAGIPYPFPLPYPIPVATGTRIAAKTADNVGTASHLIGLIAINQANVVDAGLFQQVDVERWQGQAMPVGAGAGVPLVDNRFIVHQGVATAGSAQTITLAVGASAVVDYYKGLSVAIISGTGAGQIRPISSYIASLRIAVVTRQFIVAPDNTSVYQLIPAEVPLDTAWDVQDTAHRSPGTFGGQFLSQEVFRGEVDALHSHLDTLAAATGYGTLAAAGAATATLDPATRSSRDDDPNYVGHVLAILSGTGARQNTVITGYNGATGVANVAPWPTTTPDNTSRYVIF